MLTKIPKNHPQPSWIFQVISGKIAGLQLKTNHTELTPPFWIRSNFDRNTKEKKLLGSCDYGTYQISLQKPSRLPQPCMAVSEVVGHKRALSFLHYSRTNPQLQTPPLLHSLQSLLMWVSYGKKSSHLLVPERGEVSHWIRKESFSKFQRERSTAMQLGLGEIQFVYPEAVQGGNAGHQNHHLDIKIPSSASEKQHLILHEFRTATSSKSFRYSQWNTVLWEKQCINTSINGIQ